MSTRLAFRGSNYGYPQGKQYVQVAVVVFALSQRAVLLGYEGDEQWVPRRLIEAELDDLVRSKIFGEEITVEVEEWKLKKLGWIEG